MNQISAEPRVLVVGGGPVGLALALELGLRGIGVVLLEQQLRGGVQPRAKTTNVRTMQHMRRWGIAERLRDAAPLPRDYPMDVVFCTTLLGRTLAVIENASEGAKRRDDRFPEPGQWVPQYTVEAVLRARVAELPNVKLHFGMTVTDVAQSDDGVTATAEDAATGATRTFRADYLVGADGARSRVREAIGARMEGDHAFAFNYNLILRVPGLADTKPARRAIMYWLLNPTSPGVMSPLDAGEVWAFGTLLPPGVREVPDDEMIRRARAAIGRDMEIEILTRDVWAAHRLIADRYRDRRVFLAGDACHLHPPFGGYGMNLGIADGVDLGWKLAAILRGWGGEGLLQSYEAERRPVHLRTIAAAVENYRTLSAHLLKADLDAETPEGDRAREAVKHEIVETKTREFATLGVVLGSRYRNSPVIADDGTEPPPEAISEFTPSAHPGCLAPHAWLADGSSLYDRLGQGYTLLRLDHTADATMRAFQAAAEARRLPLAVLDLTAEGLRQLYQAPLALIRPDQHVAWRGAEADAAGIIDQIGGGALAPAMNQLGSIAS